MFYRAISVLLCSISFTWLACGEKRKYEIRHKQISIGAVGDVMCHQAQLEASYDYDCDCYDFSTPFQFVKKYLASADLTIANLETTLPGKRSLFRGYPRFGAPDALVKALYEAGVDILTLANNHSMDTGQYGLERTIDVVDDIGFYHLGTYVSYDDWEERRVLFVEKNDFRLAFLNYSYSTNGIPIPKGVRVNLLDKNQIAQDIAYAYKEGVDAIIVLYHFGDEYKRWPNDKQKSYVNFAFRQGADVVIGTHPHVLQPYRFMKVRDIYGNLKKRLVLYSLGNFISNQRGRYKNGGIIFYFDFLKKKIYNQQRKLYFADVYFEPVWVFVEWNYHRRTYYLLPVKEYLKNDKKPRLPKKDYYRMLQFYRDTQSHLSRG